jgi:hypothetical protein
MCPILEPSAKALTPARFHGLVGLMPTNPEPQVREAEFDPDAWLANVYRSLLTYLDQLECDERHQAGAQKSRQRVNARLTQLEAHRPAG